MWIVKSLMVMLTRRDEILRRRHGNRRHVPVPPWRECATRPSFKAAHLKGKVCASQPQTRFKDYPITTA